MLEEKYIIRIREIFEKYLQPKDRLFVFGSSVEEEKFGDVDLAIVSESDETNKLIYKIKDALEESTLPYKFDVVDINKTKDPFRTRVLSGPKIWII